MNSPSASLFVGNHNAVIDGERCEFVGVKLEFFAFVLKEWRNYIAQYAYFILKNSLIIHEENTKEMNV